MADDREEDRRIVGRGGDALAVLLKIRERAQDAGLRRPTWGSYLYAFDTPYSAWDEVNPSDFNCATRPDSEKDEYSR